MIITKKETADMYKMFSFVPCNNPGVVIHGTSSTSKFFNYICKL